MATVNETPEVTKAGGPAELYSALRQVATAVARGVDADSVLALVAERTARLVGADGSGIIRFGANGRGRLVGNWARAGLFEGPPPRDIPLSGRSSVARVFQTGSPARVDDYASLEDPRGRFLAGLYSSGVAVPVRLGMTVWGALAVGARRPNMLPQEAESILTDFAELVSLAVAGTDPSSRAGIEALLDTLFVCAPIGVALLDVDLRLVRVNNVFADISGLRADQHAGRSPVDDPLRYPHLDMAAAARVCATGTEEPDVAIDRAAPGDPTAIRHWLTSYYPVTSPEGQLFGVGAIVVDLTEERRATEALRRERDYTAALVAAMRDGLAVAALDGSLTDVSPRFCELTGFARDELIGSTPPYPFWGSDDAGERAQLAFDRLRRGYVGDTELDFRRRDGRTLPVSVTHAQMKDAQGNVTGFVVNVRDISGVRQAEAERVRLFAAERSARNRTEILQQVSASLSKALTPEHVLETIISSTVPLVGANGGTVLLDQDSTIAPVVRQDRRMRLVADPHEYLVDRESLVSKVTRHGTPAFFETRDALREADADFERAIRVDSQAVAIVQVAQRGRVIGALAFGFPQERTFHREDRGLLVTIGDLCAQALDRARLYDAARARADIFRQRDALRTSVLRGVSHEFRSPLTAIANAADALGRVADHDLRQELLDVIGSETRRLDRFVANVLDLSRLEGGALEPRLDSCSAAELIAGALEAVDALVGDVPVKVDLPDDLPLVLADPVLTERILLNLIHNAARHGGPNIELQVRRVERSVWFVVVDDGPGVPSGMRRTIFEPFVGQRERGGLGLGLGLSHGLAIAQNGDLWLDDGRGGARFVLALPVDTREAS